MINPKNLIDRFIRYAKIDTQSDENSKSIPSTAKQLILSQMLYRELQDLGLHDVFMDGNGYVTATLPANLDRIVPTIGFLAHVDTSPDMTGAEVKPRLFPNWDGRDILLNAESNTWMRVSEFPELNDYKGRTLIVTDGTTLLGADDKAGIAEIMAMLEYLVRNPRVKHGTVRVAFTTDEEIGGGIDHFDLNRFKVDFAYTIDGGPVGELEYENFNAASARVTIHGRNVHPGSAKGKMKNAIHIGHEFNAIFPQSERPEYTEGYEGFYHLTRFEGDVEKVELHYIVRDHSKADFEARKRNFDEAAQRIDTRYGLGTVQLDIKDQYFNMREKIEPEFHIVELAKGAMLKVGVKPLIKPVRGGTDGARLSYLGIPCPNIFTGGHNFHGKFEFIPVESMVKAVEVIVQIVVLNASSKTQ